MRKKAEPIREMSTEDLARWADLDTCIEPSELAKLDMEGIAQKHAKKLAEAYVKLMDA